LEPVAMQCHGHCALSMSCGNADLAAVAQVFDGADVLGSQLQGNPEQGTITSLISLFRGRVEKGVIRRARIRTMVAAQHLVTQRLEHEMRQFRAAPPPLAT